MNKLGQKWIRNDTQKLTTEPPLSYNLFTSVHHIGCYGVRCLLVACDGPSRQNLNLARVRILTKNRYGRQKDVALNGIFKASGTTHSRSEAD